jgi:hypothetical protein
VQVRLDSIQYWLFMGSSKVSKTDSQSTGQLANLQSFLPAISIMNELDFFKPT